MVPRGHVYGRTLYAVYGCMYRILLKASRILILNPKPLGFAAAASRSVWVRFCNMFMNNNINFKQILR